MEVVIHVMRAQHQHQQGREVHRRRLHLLPTRATRGETMVLPLRAVAVVEVDTTTRATTSPVLPMGVAVLHLPHAAAAGAVAPTAGAPMAAPVATGDKRPSFPDI